MNFVRLLQKGVDRLKPGVTVSIHSLQGAMHLNGQTATCQAWDAGKSRWLVRTSGGEEKLLRPENLAVDVGLAEPTLQPEHTTRELQIGDVIEARQGFSMDGFFEAMDEGVVHSFLTKDDGEVRVAIVWTKTGKTTSIKKEGWETSMRLVRTQSLGVGDIVQALPGTEVDMAYYGPGDEGVVESVADKGRSSSHVRVFWTRTGVRSDIPMDKWMSFCRILQKYDPAAPPSKRPSPATLGAPSRPPPPQFKVGMHARITGLQSAAHRNGAMVSCQKFDEAKGRWLVHIVTDEVVVKPIEMLVRPVNLLPV